MESGLVSAKRSNSYNYSSKTSRCLSSEFEAYVKGETLFNRQSIMSNISDKFINVYNNNALNSFVVTRKGSSDAELDFKHELTKPLIFNILTYGSVYVAVNEDYTISNYRPFEVSFNEGIWTLPTEKRVVLDNECMVETENGMYTLPIKGFYHIKYREAIYPKILDLVKLYDDTYTELNREMHKASTKIITSGEVERLNADQYATMNPPAHNTDMNASSLIVPIQNGFRADQYKMVLDKIYDDIVKILNVTSELDMAYATATAVIDRDTAFEAMINDINTFTFITLREFLQDWYRLNLGFEVEITCKPFEKNNTIVKATLMQQLSNVFDVKSATRILNPYATDEEVLLKTAMLKYEQGKPLFLDEENVLKKYNKL